MSSSPDPQDSDAIEDEVISTDGTVIAQAFRWSLLGLVLLGAVVFVVATLLSDEEGEVEEIIDRDPIVGPGRLVTVAEQQPPLPFVDITEEIGVSFVHDSGATGEKLLPETMVGGVAWFDMDDDQDPDLLLTGGRSWPWDNSNREVRSLGLYRNDAGQFVDVTSGSGFPQDAYVMGPAIGDVDGDGDLDVFLSCLGQDRLLFNEGGTFSEVPNAGGAAGPEEAWSSSSGFFDYDRDGDLDLFVCRYVQWSRTIDMELAFTLNGTDRAYGPPTNYQGAHCRLFENDGSGAFRDVSAERGIEVVNPATGLPLGKALALTICDFDRDGWLDVMVANDTVQNFMFHNQEGAFVEIGASSGVAFDRLGASTGAMGIDVSEPRGDARLAIAVANFANEASSLYAAEDPDHPLRFTDMSGAEGLGTPSRQRLSFGLCFFDVDMDGREDLLQINGHLEEEIAEVQASQSYRQPAQLFWNCGHDAKRCLALAPNESVGDLANPLVGRGAGFADFDGDGDLDLAVAQAGAPAVMYRNDFPSAASLRVLPKVGDQPGMAIGAEVTLTVDGLTRRSRISPTRSYLTQVPAEAWFGLGRASASGTGTVSWIGGKTTSFTFDGAGTVVVRPE
jgi:hypothetical protein